MAALDLSRADWRKSSRSNGTGGSCVEVALAWRKSSRSNGAGGNCVEVAAADRVIAVRDSKNPDGPKLAIPAPAWSSFTAAIKSGTHDLY
jgi:hypothetical protein